MQDLEAAGLPWPTLIYARVSQRCTEPETATQLARRMGYQLALDYLCEA